MVKTLIALETHKKGESMKNQLIYDLPTRVFHWIFAFMFIGIFFVANNVDDESTIFSYHMLAGFILAFIVLLRIFWGFVGTKHSRFKSYSLQPKKIISYFAGIISGDKTKWAGHNPASSWASIIMFSLSLGLAITGYLMANGQEETFEDIHEIMANSFLIVALLHVAGVILHSLRHKDGIFMTMINGTKKDISISEGIRSSKPLVAFVFVILVSVFAFQLVKNFDSQNRTLHIFGSTLPLGEND